MFKFLKGPLVYGVAIPLALVLGFLVSSPDSYSFAVLGLILFFLGLPLLLKWHHVLLVFFWNTAFNAFFLPGSPDFWLLLAVISMGISVLNHVMFQTKFLSVPELSRPLLFLAAVVLTTAVYRGGLNVRSLGGGAYGGKYYFYLLGGIIGYFAFTTRQIPILKSGKMTALFFLPGISYVLGNLVYLLGPSFYFFYYFVQSGVAAGQAASDAGIGNIERIQGLAQPCIAVLCFMLARYGIRGLFAWAKPWRFFFLCLTICGGFFAGFRSVMMLLFLIFAFQFYFEGLIRTRFLPVVVALALCGFGLLLLFSDKMPPQVQRAISFLPVKVNSDVIDDATGSTEWRLQMWAVVWKDVPKYLVIGKGYSIDPTDMFLTTEAIRMGLLKDYEEALLAGDYHNGPLSIIIPFGIFGVLAFLWVLGAGAWALHSNFRHGDARLRRVNTLLLSYYLAYTVSFFFVFGAFNSQLFIFLGILGLSVSLNGGVKRGPAPKRRRVVVPVLQVLEHVPHPSPIS